MGLWIPSEYEGGITAVRMRMHPCFTERDPCSGEVTVGYRNVYAIAGLRNGTGYFIFREHCRLQAVRRKKIISAIPGEG